MKPLNRLPPWQRRLGLASGLVLLASGAAWLWLHFVVAAEGLPLPGEAWAMKLHGAAAMLAIFVFGALAGGHLRQGWQITHRHGHGLRRQRRLGVALTTLGAALAASGYALYYWVPEGARDAVGWAHAGAGFAMALLVLAHRGRRS
ncbi:MAG: hypothetical protein U1F50_14285 [Rubrivivax sp.]